MIRIIKAVIYTGQILCGAILLLSIFGLVGIVNVKLHKGGEEAGHLEFKPGNNGSKSHLPERSDSQIELLVILSGLAFCLQIIFGFMLESVLIVDQIENEQGEEGCLGFMRKSETSDDFRHASASNGSIKGKSQDEMQPTKE